MQSRNISVVIPCYNDSEYIEETLKSIPSIEGMGIEVIVVNDGSNDKTTNYLKSLGNLYTKILHQENKGVSAARNYGIRLSTHGTIVVLDSDDYFKVDFFKKGFEILEKKKDVKIVTCHARRFNKDGELDIIKPSNSRLQDFLKYNAAIGVMFRKKDWDLSGGYDEELLEGFEDWEFYIRLLRDGGISYSIPQVLFYYRIKENSRTSNANRHKFKLLNYIYRKHEDLYKENCLEILKHYIHRLEVAEQSDKKLKNSLDFRLGRAILQPLRFLLGINKL